jgi:hypothetical protein
LTPSCLVLAERRKENPNLEHSPTAVMCADGPDGEVAVSLAAVFGDDFGLLGVAATGVELPDRGCNALRDVEDGVRLSFRGVVGTVC